MSLSTGYHREPWAFINNSLESQSRRTLDFYQGEPRPFVKENSGSLHYPAGRIARLQTRGSDNWTSFVTSQCQSTASMCGSHSCEFRTFLLLPQHKPSETNPVHILPHGVSLGTWTHNISCIAGLGITRAKVPVTLGSESWAQCYDPVTVPTYELFARGFTVLLDINAISQTVLVCFASPLKAKKKKAVFLIFFFQNWGVTYSFFSDIFLIFLIFGVFVNIQPNQ